jgi:hypothetical protein
VSDAAVDKLQAATNHRMTTDATAPPLSPAKRLIFTAIVFAIPPLFLVALVLGYYTYKKLEENVVFTESFGRLDSEIGWVLRPRANSHVFHRSRFTGETFYDIHVRTNAEGFRAASVDEPIVPGGVAAVGDSWTFGTAVDHAAAYPTQLAARLGVPVANLGVPGHGTAQTILLLQRHVARLAPKAVIHVNLGLWARSICRGATRPTDILKPCFWRDPTSGAAELLAPEPGQVEASAARGVYPGGWLTAGHNTWTYYLISRPMIRIDQTLARLGLKSGQVSEDDPNTPDRGPILKASLDRFLTLAERHGFVFVLLDPDGDYSEAVRELTPRPTERLIYLGRPIAAEIAARVAHIPPERQRVPRDGHFTGEYMAGWVDVLAPRVRAALNARK